MSKPPKDVKKNIKEEKPVEVEVTTLNGKFEFRNKIVYIGSYKQSSTGDKWRDGHGKLIHPSSDNSESGQEYYEGEWKEDKMEGRGVYHYSNGDIYDGEWKDNLHHGSGTYYFTDGSRYEGEWVNHRMHGAGKYWDINNVLWSGEFRDGNFVSKEQAKLKEEKRIAKKIQKMKEIPFAFLKLWEETFAKADKKTQKDLLSPFFAKIENMASFLKENYPKYEDRTPDKWNEAIKFSLNLVNSPEVNVPKTSSELIFLDKSSLLTPQLQEELTSGQVIEIKTIVDLRTVKMAICYNRDLNRWLIVHFTEIVEKKK
jgi:hypothetical protein